MIINAYAFMTTGAAGTPNLSVNGTNIGTISTAVGINAIVPDTTKVSTFLNVGSTDALISYTATAATAGTLVVEYAVRSSDGSSNPASV